ncbi:protein SPEAR1 isoform X2 [Morus notabilis]|uniref:protein SPEAR1 isoform X2 n=1 Tax=Morus notabilis TaxID=981085 RepID=UPI000CECF20B|nr:protein SPEAR1 isoform X2 [Morus notabilis]
MGSGYFGEPNLGNDHQRGSGSSSSSSSSRKGKKSNSEKPRQPQRGLGVAQLEKIRLHGQMGCAAYGHPSLHNPNTYPTTSNFNNDDMRVQTAYSAIPSSSFSYSSTSLSSSPSYGFNPNVMMGLGEYERTNIRYGDSQPTTTTSNAMLETQYIAQPNMTRHLLNLHTEDSQHTSQKHRSTNSLGSSSTQNSESSDTQELDLELRLSL